MRAGIMKSGISFIAGCLLTVLGIQAAPASYENDFQKADLDKVPDDFLVLDGQFAVKQEGENRFLELPGAPLDTFGVLFGPTEKDGLAVSARIFGTAKGRRFPAFAVSLNGVGGYKLQVSAAKKQIELFKGETLKASVPFDWTSGKWTNLKLQVRKEPAGGWKVEGKIWTEGEPEPAAWAVSYDEKEEPIAGRAAIWGNPFSGTPIRFDDLKVTAAGDKS
jgi:hypothetical protein